MAPMFEALLVFVGLPTLALAALAALVTSAVAAIRRLTAGPAVVPAHVVSFPTRRPAPVAVAASSTGRRAA